MRARRLRRRGEPTIALINIVFLMLVFFMIAGTLAAPLDPDVRLVETAGLDPETPPDAIVLAADGTVRYQGRAAGDLTSYVASLDDAAVARIVPDRAAPAGALLRLARELEQAGARQVVIVTQQGLK